MESLTRVWCGNLLSLRRGAINRAPVRELWAYLSWCGAARDGEVSLALAAGPQARFPQGGLSDFAPAVDAGLGLHRFAAIQPAQKFASAFARSNGSHGGASEFLRRLNGRETMETEPGVY